MNSISKRKKLTNSESKQSTRPSKEEIMMKLAESVSLRSSCKRLHVGSVITSYDFKNIKAYGYNGNYAGGPNECDVDLQGNCGCVHSEINALIKAKIEETDVIFITDSPCVSCAKCIINSGIKIVYYRRDYRSQDGLNLLKKMITVIKI